MKILKTSPKIVSQLNKKVFIQRNIIKEGDDLGEYIGKIFDKIYNNDPCKSEKTKALNYVLDGKITLGTSLWTNLLQESKPMGACVVVPHDIKQQLTQYVADGVGIGLDLSSSSTPCERLLELNNILKSMDDKVQRPPAGIALLDIEHPQIDRFISLKRDENFSDWRFNLSVSMPNNFMEKVISNSKLEAKRYCSIIESMHRCAEPGIIFKDNIEAQNPLPNRKYKGVASCAEIALENGETSLFSHINLFAFLDKEKKTIDYNDLGQATATLTRLLDNVIDINLTEKVGNNHITANKRRFGIGVCGFADLLAMMGVEYGSPQSRKILANCLETINFSSKKASMELAAERGYFPLFKESRYDNFNFLIRHNENSHIKLKDWQDLYKDIQRKGLRNATTTALPPTGSSSRIVGVSYSIEPYFTLKNNNIFYQQLKKQNLTREQEELVLSIVEKTGSCQNIEFLDKHFKNIFKLGNEIPAEQHLTILETAQRFIDDGISKTINFANNASLEDISQSVLKSYKMGLKGISVYREGCLDERKIK